MIQTILKILLVAFEYLSSLPVRKAEDAKKSYANFRAGAELRKEMRARRADLNNSVDELRSPKGDPK